MTSDPDLLWITGGTTLLFGAAAVYGASLLRFLGAKRGLKPPPRSVIMIFRIWFGLLAAGAFWLLLSGHHALLGRLGTR